MQGHKFKVGDLVKTTHYSEAKIISFDPRFPKTYGIITWVKDIPKIIYGIPEREIKGLV